MPLDAASFAHACLSLSSPSPTGIDLISFELGSSPKCEWTERFEEDKRNLGVLFLCWCFGSTVSHAVVDGLERTPSSTVCFSRRSTVPPPLARILAHGLPRPDLLVSVLKEIIRVTNCAKGLIVSSGARRWAELRSTGVVSTRQTHKGVISNPLIVSAEPPPADISSSNPIPRADAAHDSKLEWIKT
ncbi:uncharacterized protein VP01_10877g1 [Puccinia sorghi]|uniref:Uncharacterized protein n=1 Tax=Puccinia sorghi TaxID=27349 RepID=A0A0L6VTG9_9BASI|nr:uncharacterized protein VP01_10877g1 [Puccinia sorghi]